MTKFITALFIFLTALGVQMAYWQLQQERKEKDPQYNIQGIYQTTSSFDVCPPSFLAQNLEIYRDEPKNLYLFDTNLAEEKLLSTPWFKSVYVEKVPPDMLYIDYTLREPYAYVADWKNMAIDHEGTLFSMHPIYTPKKIPSIYFGCDDYKKHLPLAFSLLECCKDLRKGQLTLVDLSKVAEKSLGKKEINLIFEQTRLAKTGKSYLSKHILRLPVKGYAQAFSQYKKLLPTLYEEEYQYISSQNVSLIVDLRLENLAFIKYQGNTWKS